MVGIQTLEEFGKKLERFRFAVLHHSIPRGAERGSHWDLLLEQPPGLGDGLKTFEICVPPEAWGKPSVARQLSDHRHHYLDYEGPVSGNRGHVARVMEGHIEWLSMSKHMMTLSLELANLRTAAELSEPVRGVIELRKLMGETDDELWELILEMPLPPESNSCPQARD